MVWWGYRGYSGVVWSGGIEGRYLIGYWIYGFLINWLVVPYWFGGVAGDLKMIWLGGIEVSIIWLVWISNF